MRKRNLSYYLEAVFWIVVASLPVLMYGIGYMCKIPSGSNISVFFTSTGLGSSTSLVYSTLADIFGVGGIFPLFDNPFVIQIFSWFVSVMLIRLAVEVLLFIPRLCLKWAQNFTD